MNNDASFYDAKRLYLEQYGDPMVTNTYLKIALVLVCLVAVGLALVDLKTIRTFQNFRPLVIRIDDLGRAEARKHGLVTDKTVEISQKKSLRVVTLTKAGHRLLKNAHRVPDDQAIYHGLRKPREVEHDADLYRLYQKEASNIERTGGRPLRVILDYELKKNLNRDLALLGPDRDNEASKTEIAEKHGLQLMNGKISVPDLRIEYETAETEIRHEDLELATREYRPRAVAEKAAAGFSLYSRPEDASRLRRILDERELTAHILTL